jgi:hypothetical protein
MPNPRPDLGYHSIYTQTRTPGRAATKSRVLFDVASRQEAHHSQRRAVRATPRQHLRASVRRRGPYPPPPIPTPNPHPLTPPLHPTLPSLPHHATPQHLPHATARSLCRSSPTRQRGGGARVREGGGGEAAAQCSAQARLARRRESRPPPSARTPTPPPLPRGRSGDSAAKARAESGARDPPPRAAWGRCPSLRGRRGHGLQCVPTWRCMCRAGMKRTTACDRVRCARARSRPPPSARTPTPPPLPRGRSDDCAAEGRARGRSAQGRCMRGSGVPKSRGASRSSPTPWRGKADERCTGRSSAGSNQERGRKPPHLAHTSLADDAGPTEIAGPAGNTGEGTRTPNLLIRSQMLYPIELRPQGRRG